MVLSYWTRVSRGTWVVWGIPWAHEGVEPGGVVPGSDPGGISPPVPGVLGVPPGSVVPGGVDPGEPGSEVPGGVPGLPGAAGFWGWLPSSLPGVVISPAQPAPAVRVATTISRLVQVFMALTSSRVLRGQNNRPTTVPSSEISFDDCSSGSVAVEIVPQRARSVHEFSIFRSGSKIAVIQ